MKKFLFVIAGVLWFAYLYAGMLDDVRAVTGAKKEASHIVSTVSIYHPPQRSTSDR